MTSEKKNGNQKSEVDVLQEKLDKLHKSVLLVNFNFNLDNIETVLDMSRQQLSKMTDKERAMYSFELRKYAAHIKSKENRYKAIRDWLYAQLNRLTAATSKEYCDPKYTKFEDQRSLVSFNNDYGSVLAKQIRYYQAYFDELKDLSRQIDYIAIALKDIKDERIR